MYSYTSAQWLAFFYLYSFIGWCFESTVVSLDKRHFVNRGFMRGPMLPLYGFGAITVLFSTMAVRDNPVLTFLIGSLAATLLEYVTGVCMEALFQVRYWDYSDHKFQFQGHICLTSSIAWGVLSLVMAKIHEPFEHFIMLIPSELLNIIVLVLTFFAAIDFANSFRAAIDLKHLLMHSQKLQEELLLLQERTEQLEQRIQREKELLAQKREQLSQELTQELQAAKEKQIIYRERLREQISNDKLRLLLRNPSAHSHKYREILERIKQHHTPGADS